MLFSLPVAISRCALRQISQFFKGAPRRRAAPGNQSVGSPQSRRLRLARYRSGRARGLPHTMSGKRAADEEGVFAQAKGKVSRYAGNYEVFVSSQGSQLAPCAA